MITTEQTSYGFRIEMRGVVRESDVQAFLEDLDDKTKEMDSTFSVFVDMRTMVPLSHDSLPIMVRCQRLARERGMIRSIVVTTNPATTQQFKRIAGESGIHRTERYLDAEALREWEKIGRDWLIHGIEPSVATLKTISL